MCMRRSMGSGKAHGSGQAEASASDQVSQVRPGGLASESSADLHAPALASLSVSAKRAPPIPPVRHRRRRRPQTWLELIDSAIDDWPRTCRLVVLLVATALSGATILFVVQLHPDKWVSVLTVAGSVVGAAGFKRHRSRRDQSSDSGGEANSGPSQQRARRRRR